MVTVSLLRSLLRRTIPLVAWLALGCTGTLEGDLKKLPGGGSAGADSQTTDGEGVQCQPGLTPCGLDCVDLNASPAHCGDCGQACAAGEVCALGTCGTDCVAPYTECDGQCVRLETDAAHCGECGRSCDAGVPCFGGDCGCPTGALICNGQCVDPQSNRAHCGDCNVECAADELCVLGNCQPESEGCPLDQCDGACVDTQTSPVHCGGCGQPCATGQVCEGGSCECVAQGTTLCGNTCVNLLSDANHCGDCNNPCLGGYPCTDGECRCPEGEELCAGTCADLDSSLIHCGACGMACPEGQTCIAGRCSGSTGDECTSNLAVGITLRELAVLQAGKISVMSGGEPVERSVDVVAGKAAVFRAYVDLDGSFDSRAISARLSLMEGDDIEQFFHKRTVSSSSSEANWSSTFNIQVPAGKLTSSTQFVVELVECDGPPSGSGGAPRYPAMGTAELGARDLGRLQLRYIPIHAPNGSAPNTSAERLALYTSYVEAMFPVAGVDTSVGAPLQVPSAINADGSGWNDALEALRSRHLADNSPNGLYYYGLFEPSDSNYCRQGCTAGLGYVVDSAANSYRQYRVSLGLSRGNRGSAETMAHEVGHTHGRPHSPCGGVSGPDPSYPHAGGQIGWYGFETTSTLHTPDRTDIMGYCSNKWISDYVYQRLVERAAALNGTAPLSLGLPVATWRTLRVGPFGPQWGAPITRPTEPAGTPEPARILDAQGNVVTEVTAYRIPIDHLGAAELLVPEPEPSWHAIVIQGEVPLAFDSVDSSLP